MTPILIIILIVFAIAALEGAAFLLYARKVPVNRKRILDFLLKGSSQTYTEASMKSSHVEAPRYAEHPFTGWSLNPGFRNVYGETVHNRHGFRSSQDFEGFDQESDPETLRIYCAGGSTTYGVFIERNEETWPEILGEKISAVTGRKVQVMNGGVGGFNTYQSYIRLSAYIDYLRPHLVVVYHAKNDLTPFYIGELDQQKAHPDYSNLMRSLNFKQMSKSINPLARWSAMARLWAAWRLSRESMGLGYVYSNRGEPDPSGLLSARTDFSIIETMQRNMVRLCRGRDVNLIYMTQRVEDPLFTRHIQEINDRIRGLDNPKNGCYVYDLDRELEYNPDYLFDKMHFTPKGNEQVAEHLAQFIQESRLLSSGSNRDTRS